MPHYILDATFDRLLNDLAGAFMRAATSTQVDLHDALVLALADADLLPEVCRGDGLATA
jgi:hypothetical protein